MASIRKHRGKWQVRVRRDNVTATRTFITHADALQWAREAEIKVDRRELDAVRPQGTLGDLIRRYLTEVTPGKRGAHIEAVVLGVFLRDKVCGVALADLTVEHFKAYRDARLREVQPQTLKRQLNIVRHALETARTEWRAIQSNPLVGMRLKAPDVRRERRLQDGEFGRLIEAVRRGRARWLEPIVRIAVETGMRRGEILAIQPKHFDAGKRTLLIPVSKNGRARTIPLTREAARVLAARPRLDKTGNAVRLAWERVVQRAGIDDLHFHDLRHEAISRFFEAGMTLPEVAEISGHRDARMLLRYAQATRRTIVEKMDRYFA
jgi:integrase